MNLAERLKRLIERISAHPRFGWIVQFVKFGLVGASNTLIHLSVYYLCVYAFGMHYQLANVIAFLVSVLNAYFWNSRYVFASGERKGFGAHAKPFIKMLAAYGGTYLISLFLLWLWVEKLHVGKGVAPLLNLLVTIPLNYILNKFWAFAKQKTCSQKQERK